MMESNNKWYGVLAALLLLATLGGCSSTPSYGDAPEKLSIRILPNASKQFIYRVGMPERAERQLDPRSRPARAPGKRDYEKLQARAGYVVKATGYCREGYLELDFRLNNYVQWLRGECREGASEADLQAWGERRSLSLDRLEQ